MVLRMDALSAGGCPEKARFVGVTFRSSFLCESLVFVGGV